MARWEDSAFQALVPEPGEAPMLTIGRLLGAGIIGFQSCTSCSAVIFPPRVLCPVCGGTHLMWRESTGQGTIYSTTTVYERGQDPYNVVLVNLAEGFRLMSRVEGIPSDDVTIGMPVLLSVRPAEGTLEPLIICTVARGNE